MPLRQHNALLLAAGFAPAWTETELGAPELAQISSAVDYMFAQQEPLPAVAVDPTPEFAAGQRKSQPVMNGGPTCLRTIALASESGAPI